MKKLLFVVLLSFAAGPVYAADMGGIRSSQADNVRMQQADSAKKGKKRPRSRALAQKPHMTPGRNFNNPAANRFGDATLPNTYVPGHPDGYNMWISRENL